MNQRWLALLITGSLFTGAGGTYAAMKWVDSVEPSAVELETDTGVPVKETPEEATAQDTVNMEKIAQAYQLIKGSYVEDVKDDQLIEGAVQGMLASLKDPYSVYMNKEKSKQFNQSLEPSFEGIGAEVSMVDGRIVIVSPFKDSPAEKAGIKPNDQILKVNGESVEGLDLYEATVKIRGKKGTTVKIEIQRQGLKEPLVIFVKRDEIPQITVYSKIKKQGDQSIAYIEITSFSKETASDFSKQLKKLEKEKIDGLILDVRGNPGGLLDSVKHVLEEFVSKENPYVQIEKRNGERKQYYTTLEKDKDYPIVVLIDKGSASASEILAGALQEAEGFKLIGEESFGKGTVQSAIPMGDGSNIKLTLYKWLTPDGNWIHNKGIKPDVEVKQSELFQLHPIQITETLEKNMNNEQVKNVQQILANIGYGPSRTDGYFNSGTEAAVKAFQLEHDLPSIGKVDEKTAKALEQKVIDEQKKEKNDLQLQTAYKYIEKIKR
nr:S41 family peptidase [uncultured Bacillus sp.]